MRGWEHLLGTLPLGALTSWERGPHPTGMHRAFTRPFPADKAQSSSGQFPCTDPGTVPGLCQRHACPAECRGDQGTCSCPLSAESWPQGSPCRWRRVLSLEGGLRGSMWQDQRVSQPGTQGRGGTALSSVSRSLGGLCHPRPLSTSYSCTLCVTGRCQDNLGGKE